MQQKLADPPPPGPSLSAQIRAMKVAQTLYFDANPVSVRAIVSRTKSTISGSKWVTRGEGNGTRVWRLK